MNALDHARLHTAALLHELPHLRALAGAGAMAFPYPDWYVPDALPEEIVRRVAVAQTYAMGEEDAAALSGHDPQLRPILASLANLSSPLRLHPGPLHVDEGTFPAAPLSADDFRAACRACWEELCEAAAHLHDVPPADYPQRLRPLLEWQASRLPGPHGPADLSWYARAHTRAAFALACAGQPADQPQRLMLLGAELSGIQGFLYDIGTALAAKLLKGRSFYLHLLCDSIRLHILQTLGLDEGQTLMDSGGRFLLLVPAVEPARLADMRLELGKKLWQTHQERLGLHLAAVPLDPASLCKPGGLRQAMDAWEAAMKAARRRPLHGLLVHHPDWLFSPQGRGGAVRRDDLTGEELSPEEAVKVRPISLEPEEAQDLRVGEATWLQLTLSKQLKGATTWLSSHTPPACWDEHWVQPLGLPIWHRLLHPQTPVDDFLGPGTTLRRINPASLDEARDGFVWYGGAKFPLDATGDIATFDAIATEELDTDEAYEARGRNLVRLAHLRMDVDDLGSGLRANLRSLTRYIALSRALDHFFKGHLDWLRNQPAYRDRTVLVYAGGDDLYAVGAWNTVAEWAFAVRANFQRYCGDAVLPGLSGGLVLTGRRHPLAHAATLAGEVEQQAKDHIYGEQPKDSLSVLGQAWRWRAELPQLLAIRDTLEAFVQEGVFNKGLLQRLMRHHADSRAPQGEADSPALQRWQFTAAWDLVRYREVLDKRIASAEKNQKLRTATASDSGPTLERLKAGQRFLKEHILELYNGPAQLADPLERIALLGIAARWAELRGRSGVAPISSNPSTTIYLAL